ncbi:heme-binding protein [uncultured Brevibacillus sp.]|uniref:GlcG/HbpS family heme-binding protein n=1 Tax=uncultured Brevibacillus sp. TaxID=169970 RepID=UPI00259490FB|nr:heme-binding protein [uncultured Brevibacillus sp.]
MKIYREKKTISSEMGNQMAEAAVKQAKQLGIKINVAIVDEGGLLVHFRRMDQAPILSIEIAQNKAYTAIAFGLPTHEWHPLIRNEPALREGIVHTPRLVVFGGGFPIKIGEEIIGGIGISGGSADEDMACCQAALSLIQ